MRRGWRFVVRYGRNVQGVDCVMPPILLVSPFPPGCRIGPVGRVAQSVNIVLQLWESGLEFTVGEVNEEGGRGDEMKLKLEDETRKPYHSWEFHCYFRRSIYFQGWNTTEDGDWLLSSTKSICGLA